MRRPLELRDTRHYFFQGIGTLAIGAGVFSDEHHMQLLEHERPFAVNVIYAIRSI